VLGDDQRSRQVLLRVVQRRRRRLRDLVWPLRAAAPSIAEFEVAPDSYDDPECHDDVPARVTVRTRRGNHVFPITETLIIAACPYDSA